LEKSLKGRSKQTLKKAEIEKNMEEIEKPKKNSNKR